MLLSGCQEKVFFINIAAKSQWHSPGANPHEMKGNSVFLFWLASAIILLPLLSLFFL